MSKVDFLKELASEAKPVKVIAPVWLRTTLWLVASLVVVLGMMLLIQPFRPNFGSQVGVNHFTLETIFSLLPFVTAGFLSVYLSIPGVGVRAWHWVLAVAPYVFFVLSILSGFWLEPSLSPSMVGKRPTCVLEVLVLSWIPLAGLVYMIRQGYFQITRKLFALLALAASALPMGLMQIACMHEATHILKFHIGPSLLVVIITVGFGSFFIRNRF